MPLTEDSVHEDRFNPFTDDFQQERYRIYSHFREVDPVHWGMPQLPPHEGGWYFFRHADVMTVLRDKRFVRSSRTVNPDEPPRPLSDEYKPFVAMASKWMLFRDPPDHTRLRSLVNKAFTPRMVERLHPRIEDIANELLDKIESTGSMDLISDYAFPLPVIVIAELLGIPSEDRLRFKDWSNAIGAGIDARTSVEVYGPASSATGALSDYLKHIVAKRRSNPKEDLISALIAAKEHGDRLDDDEMIAMCILLLAAGHETTVHLIGNGTLALLQHPEQMEALRRAPALISSAVEELLRYDSPVQMVGRIAAEDVEIGGKLIRKGDGVSAIMGSANRDPEVFAYPETFDISRKSNQHQSFGAGIHYCLGAPLARKEAQTAIKTLTTRFPSLSPLTKEPIWRPSIVFRGLQELRVSLGAGNRR